MRTKGRRMHPPQWPLASPPYFLLPSPPKPILHAEDSEMGTGLRGDGVRSGNKVRQVKAQI